MVGKKREKTLIPSKAKCPKCKSSTLLLTECWKDHVIQFDQWGGKIDKMGNLEEGDPYKVTGQCLDCEHSWTFRGVSQITDLFDGDAVERD